MPMPLGNFIKNVFGGAVSLSDDWSCGVWYQATSDAPSQGDLDTATTNLLTNLQSGWWNDSTHPWRDQNAAGTKLESVRAYYYHNGVLTLQSEATQSPSSGTGSDVHPSYVACCVTLKTAGFGRRKRGRIYLPATAAGTDTNSGLFTGLTLEALQNLGNVIGLYGIGDDVAIPAQPVVVSQTGGSFEPITHLRYDNKPDTQHGRESKTSATSTAETPLFS